MTLLIDIGIDSDIRVEELPSGAFEITLHGHKINSPDIGTACTVIYLKMMYGVKVPCRFFIELQQRAIEEYYLRYTEKHEPT